MQKCMVDRLPAKRILKSREVPHVHVAAELEVESPAARIAGTTRRPGYARRPRCEVLQVKAAGLLAAKGGAADLEVVGLGPIAAESHPAGCGGGGGRAPGSNALGTASLRATHGR